MPISLLCDGRTHGLIFLGLVFSNENTQFVREMHSHRNILLTQNTRFVLRFRAGVCANRILGFSDALEKPIFLLCMLRSPRGELH